VSALPAFLTSRISTGAEDECWEWTGFIGSKGYGTVYLPVGTETSEYVPRGRMLMAHRLVYSMLVKPIPAGLQIDHLCRVRKCVNPAHMEPVTQRENILRGVGVTAINAAKTHCIHGREFTSENTPSSRRGDRQCRQCTNERMRARRRAVAS
jgi:hypothetical protein